MFPGEMGTSDSPGFAGLSRNPAAPDDSEKVAGEQSGVGRGTER